MAGPLVWRGVLWLATGATLLFLVAPIAAIVPLGFSSGSFLSYPMPGLSLRWYAAFLESDRWLLALRNSLIVGGAATLFATILGTLAALGLAGLRFRFKPLVTGIILAPMIVPVVIFGVGMYFVFAPLGLTATFTGLILGHTALAVPFVVVTVGATLANFDMNLVRAAASLGASPVTVFRRVILPLIAPGVVSGALFAFITSFDEVVLTLFIAGPEQRTLPRQMFDGIREDINPTLVAVATILVTVSIVLMAAIEVLRRRGERLRGGGR